ncbi:helix-turn-helix transcriptional regulator [Methanosarcina sp. Mfa9]|uniref:helix-turn-helix transcriptional regulator n=1 Tax=Methanosarcina sp. Mfa9 TaxID=3439063 RepID=UPI003F85B670
MKAYELFSELGSEVRLGILKALGEKPLKFTVISGHLKITSPETSRQLNRLIDAALLEKRPDGFYSLTPFGNLVLASVPNLEFIALNSSYFLTHDVSPIPPELLRRVDMLSGGKVVTGVFEVMENVDSLFDGISEYSWYLSDNFPRCFLPKIEQKLDAGVEFRSVYPEEFLTNVLRSVGEKVRSGIEFRTLDEIKIALNVNDHYAFLGLPGQDGKIDRDCVLIGSDSGFKDWCRELFEYYWGRSSKYYP